MIEILEISYCKICASVHNRLYLLIFHTYWPNILLILPAISCAPLVQHVLEHSAVYKLMHSHEVTEQVKSKNM